MQKATHLRMGQRRLSRTFRGWRVITLTPHLTVWGWAYRLSDFTTRIAGEPKDPQRSLLLAVEALRVTLEKNEPRIPASEQALRDGLAHTERVGRSGHEVSIMAVAISPDSHWLVTGYSFTACGICAWTS